ncbi:MAG: di-heme enzyme [Anaeromyxobacter sp.]|nr:di-heme enzyme [Anaeromyxobacter sp.]MBL0277217.1 di-heme enzyme [Anaeromyxobacter sp.]
MRTRLGLALAAVLAAACGGGSSQDLAAAYAWDLPAGFPVPPVPADNPMSDVKVELGRRLFYDARLSGNQTQSCASCHEQARAFTDGRARGLGSTGELHPRGPQQLANLAWFRTFTWANSVIPSLEHQALGPILGQDPVELGISGLDAVVIARLEGDPHYPRLFREAFPADVPAVSYVTIVKALAAFERTLISGDSPYDRFQRGDQAALTVSAQRGMGLFSSERVGCAKCHAGFLFSDAAAAPGEVGNPFPFHNLGLYDVDGLGAYPPGGTGLHGLTSRPEDMGKFRTPPLRNVAVTAPFMHDGSVATLGEVVELFAAGGRVRMETGAPSPLQSELVQPFSLTAGEKADLVAFLEALTDQQFLTDPRFSNPFAR